jgi:pimeloyl-ACP methyl ester carboxylesterase
MALAHGSRWVADESKARLTIIEGAGHCANMEVPDVFNKHFREFLRFVEMGGE